jgi:uracil-DNA glycosylase
MTTMPLHPALRTRSLGGWERRLARCRLCDRAGEPVESRPIGDVRPTHRALILGQAPGISEPALRRPFAGDAGRRLRAWFAPLGLDDEERFRATFGMTAVMRCYPGRDPGARGDRRPTPGQLARCAPWTDAVLRLLDPPLLIPVGGLAIAAQLGPARLADVVGRRFELDRRVLIPLPHPSGASAWTNSTANRALIAEAVGLIGAELRRLGVLD